MAAIVINANAAAAADWSAPGGREKAWRYFQSFSRWTDLWNLRIKLEASQRQAKALGNAAKAQELTAEIAKLDRAMRNIYDEAH